MEEEQKGDITNTGQGCTLPFPNFNDGGIAMPYSQQEKKKAIKQQDKAIKKTHLKTTYVKLR